MQTQDILAFIQLAIQSAPGVVKVVEDGKKLIDGLAQEGEISKAVQDEQKAWADEHQAAVLTRPIPPEFTVEPD